MKAWTLPWVQHGFTWFNWFKGSLLSLAQFANKLRASDGPESLLTRCVPDLELDCPEAFHWNHMGFLFHPKFSGPQNGQPPPPMAKSIPQYHQCFCPETSQFWAHNYSLQNVLSVQRHFWSVLKQAKSLLVDRNGLESEINSNGGDIA